MNENFYFFQNVQNFPENIHTHPKEGHWNYEEGVSKAKMFKGKY